MITNWGTMHLELSLLTHLVRLVVEHDQISVADVESRKMLTGVLGIKNVLIDNKGCASSVGCTPTVYIDRDR